VDIGPSSRKSSKLRACMKKSIDIATTHFDLENQIIIKSHSPQNASCEEENR
jgi:hypothetical protein